MTNKKLLYVFVITSLLVSCQKEQAIYGRHCEEAKAHGLVLCEDGTKSLTYTQECTESTGEICTYFSHCNKAGLQSCHK